MGVGGGIAVGEEGHPVAVDGAAVMAVQVEIAVVGQTAEGVPAADRPVAELIQGFTFVFKIQGGEGE